MPPASRVELSDAFEKPMSSRIEMCRQAGDLLTQRFDIVHDDNYTYVKLYVKRFLYERADLFSSPWCHRSLGRSFSKNLETRKNAVSRQILLTTAMPALFPSCMKRWTTTSLRTQMVPSPTRVLWSCGKTIEDLGGTLGEQQLEKYRRGLMASARSPT